jgi:hypothetical protein
MYGNMAGLLGKAHDRTIAFLTCAIDNGFPFTHVSKRTKKPVISKPTDLGGSK